MPMDYNDYSKPQLIEIIKEQQILSEQLLLAVDRSIDSGSRGEENPSHWFFNLKTNRFTINSKRYRLLGLNPPESSIGLPVSDLLKKIHPEDEKQIRKTIKAMLDGTIASCSTEFLMRPRAGGRDLFCENIQIVQYDEDGKPLMLSGQIFSRNSKGAASEGSDSREFCMRERTDNDHLTQVLNYRALILELSAAAADYDRTKQSFVLAMLDIDNFRKFNETNGRICGNKALISLASLIVKHIRQCDVVGRYSGDRFMIIFRETSLNHAIGALERIRTAAETCCSGEEEAVRIAVSGGARQYHGENPEELIDLVEFNLRIAKRCGKNRIL